MSSRPVVSKADLEGNARTTQPKRRTGWLPAEALRARWFQLLGLAAIALVTWGCTDKGDDHAQHGSPSADNTAPDGVPSGGGARSLIVGNQLGGNGEEGLYFVEPIAASPNLEGAFDGKLSPVIRIDELEGSAKSAGRSVATFTRSSIPPAGRVDVEANTYIATWDIPSKLAGAGKQYRVRVLLDGRELGSVDATVPPDVKEQDTLVLRIRFFLNGCAAIVCAADACHEAGICDARSLRCSTPPKPDGTACSDGDACTREDVCKAGTCVPGTPTTCSAPDDCHEAGVCDRQTGQCVAAAKPDGAACDDLDPCTQMDACVAGSCRATPVECAAPDACHEHGTCDRGTGACITPAKPDGSSCSDSDGCTQSDSCIAGACVPGPPVVCPPVDQCQNSRCSPESSACINDPKPDGTPCDDGNACTRNDRCVSGACVPGTATTCTAIDVCHDAGTCDPGNGSCSTPPRAEGALCAGGACRSDEGPLACVPSVGLLRITPNLGDVFGGARVTVDVDGDVVAVRIGGSPCTDLVKVSPTAFTCTAPALAAGRYDVTVSDGYSWGPGLRSAYEAWHPTVDYPAARVFQSDRGVVSAGAAARSRIGVISDNVKGTSTHDPVDGAGFFRLDSGRLLLVGGAPGGFAYRVVNTVWYSDDNGASWGVLLNHDPTTTTRFHPGHTQLFAVHTDGGVPYAYVIGGDPFAPNSDVWRTPLSGDGTTWTRISTAAPTTTLVLGMIFSYHGALYIAGGQHDIYDVSTAVSTVHRSTDGGVTWTTLGDAPWAPRGMVLGQLPEHNGLIYLIGGGAYDARYRVGDTYYNDVWSFDGTTWRLVLPNGHTQFPAVRYHSILEANNRLWTLNGVAAGTVELASIHSSGDGEHWRPIGMTLPWVRTHAQASLATPDGILTTDGFKTSSLYKIVTDEGSLVSSWGDQGSGQLFLTQTVDDAKPLFTPRGFQSGLRAMPGLVFSENQNLQLPAVDASAAGLLETYFIARTLNFDSAALAPANAPATVIGDSTVDALASFGFTNGSLQYKQYAGGWQATERGAYYNDDVARLFGAKQSATRLRLFVGSTQVGATDTTNVAFDAPRTGWNVVGGGYNKLDGAPMVLGAVVVVRPTVESSATFLAKLNMWSKKWGTN